MVRLDLTDCRNSKNGLDLSECMASMESQLHFYSRHFLAQISTSALIRPGVYFDKHVPF